MLVFVARTTFSVSPFLWLVLNTNNEATARDCIRAMDHPSDVGIQAFFGRDVSCFK
jgi:hypothetical protein